ncbi:MAG: SPOR domain-containing protein [Betaproteobacteria bacterium]
MTDQQLDTSNDIVSSEGIFLRAADRSRFDYVMRAVRESSQSLALSSNSEGVLDHYGRLVLAKLRKTPSLQVEVFLPQNTEQLLERFNQILSDISIEDARNPENRSAPRRVLLAHDAKAISQRDLQLLARLIQDFPGANVSLVLLVDKLGMQLHERTLDSIGQRLLRWPVEIPTRSEGDALLQIARAMGREVEVKKVLTATGFAEIKIAPKPKKEASTETSTAQARFEAQLAAARKERQQQEEQAEAELQRRTEPSFDAAPAPKPASSTSAKRGIVSRLLRWSAGLLLMLVVSVGVVLLLFADKASPLLANSPILKDNLPPWAMDTLVAVVGKPPTAKLEEQKAADAAGANGPAAPQPADQTKPPAPSVTAPAADSNSVRTESAPATVKTDVASAVPVQTEAKPEAKPDPKAASMAEPKAESKPEAKPELKPADALAPRSERGVDQLIRQTKAGSFFVQHVSLGSMAEAQEWRAQFGALTKAMIVAVNTSDKGVKFAVISGPFATRKEAETYAARGGMPADPWLRPVKSLQTALLPASR